MNKNTFFPTEILRSQKELEKSFVEYKNTLSADSVFHFSIALNQNWKPVQIANQIPSKSIPIASVALFQRTFPPNSEISVVAHLIPREINPTDYHQIILSNDNHVILMQREISTIYGITGDILSENLIDGRKVIIRSLCIKDGNRVHFVFCSIESEKYDIQIAEEFLIAITTFKLLHPTDEIYAEEVKRYYLEEPEPTAINFVFPLSWQFKTDSFPPNKGNSFSFVNNNSEGSVGNISFCAVPTGIFKTANDFFEVYSTQLKKNDVFIEESNLIKEQFRKFKDAWTISSVGKKKGIKVVISAFIIVEDYSMILIGLIGLAKEIDIVSWAINKRAFEILKNTLEVEYK